MKRTSTALLLTLSAALLLTACDITVRPPGPLPPPEPDFKMDVGTLNEPEVRALGTLANGQSTLVRVNLRGNQSRADLLRVQINRNLRLELLTNPTLGTPERLAISVSPTHFAKEPGGLLSASSELGSQAIVALPECKGSCIQYDPSAADSFLVRVTNRSGADTRVELSAFVDEFADPYEAEGNDSVGNAVPVRASGSSVVESGAIELIGDVDYWRFTRSGTVVFDTLGDIGVTAEFVDGRGNPVEPPLLEDRAYPVERNTLLKVYLPGGRAGIAATNGSYYTLDVNYD